MKTSHMVEVHHRAQDMGKVFSKDIIHQPAVTSRRE